MLTNPLTEQDITNIEDEHAFVLDIWHEFERLANNYIQECNKIQNTHKSRIEKMNREQSAQIERMNKDQAQPVNQLDYEKNKALEERENKYKSDLCEISQKKEDTMLKNYNVLLNSSKYCADMRDQIESRKKQLKEYLEEINHVESTINANSYYKIDWNITELVEVNVTTLEQLMGKNLALLANEINELEKNILKKLINSSLLRSKCVEFFSIKCKAQELYEKEVKEQDTIIQNIDNEAANMMLEASKREQSELQKLNEDIERTKQAYLKDCCELEQSFKTKKREILSNQVQAKIELLHGYEEEKAILEENKQNLLVNALKKYQEEQIYYLPPQVLQKYVNFLMARKICKSQEFRLARMEPLNITVGYIQFKSEQFLEDKNVKQFITQNYGFILKNDCFVFPYTVAINESLSLYYKYNNKMAEIAKKSMQTLCLNAFLATPPNKMRFHFFDPLRLGQSFALFKLFEDENSSNYNIILGGIQTEENSIEQQLQVVVDHIKAMQVSTFKGQYRNIREYNVANILNHQPYNIIGVMDFPAGFTEKSIDLLSQIVATGKECGVYVIIMSCDEQISNVDQKIKGKIANIERMCNTFQTSELGYLNDNGGEKNNNIRYIIDNPLDVSEVVRIAPIMKKGIKDAGRIVIEYENIAPPQNKYLKYTTGEGISIPIGLSGASDIQQLNLGMPGSQSVHALICGQIGSGKSRLLHAIITGALLQYPKEELEIYLVDFKSGTEFKIYADYNLPNFKVIAIESEQEFGLSVLRDIKKEGERRAQIFNTCTKSDITSYNNGPDVERYGRMPRILIVIDEFHVLFSNSNPAIATEASQIMDGILRLDRSYGFHMVLCSQSIRGMNAINEAALAQIAVRIALKCPKEDADIVLGKGSDAMAQIEENDAGSAVYLPAISSPKTNNKFRVGYLSPEKHTQILKMLDNYYNKAGVSSSARVLVSDVSDSRNSVFQKYVADGHIITKDRVLHLGEPLKVDANLEVRFDQSIGNNLLLIGKNTQKAQNILFFATLDLVLQRVNHIRNGKKPTNIYVINYCDGVNIDLEDKLQYFCSKEPSMVHYYSSANALSGIEAVFHSFENKCADDSDDWVIISNLALASDLRGSVYGSYRENANRFEKVLSEGPSKGVFCVTWCDDPAIFRAKFGNAFAFFGKRIVFDVSDEEALAMADVVKDESINRNNAYFYQVGKGKEKFRPYSTPMDNWIDTFCTERLDNE